MTAQPFDFAHYGIVPGAYVRGELLDSRYVYNEDITGVVIKIYPSYVVIRKWNGRKTTLHRAHVLCREVWGFKVEGKRNKEAS